MVKLFFKAKARITIYIYKVKVRMLLFFFGRNQVDSLLERILFELNKIINE